MNKIAWALIGMGILYLVYSAVIAKHGLMLVNTIVSVILIVMGLHELIKK